jgi:tight adherence protein B
VSPLSELLLLAVALIVIVVVVWRLLRTRSEVRQDQEHLGRLLGKEQTLTSDEPDEKHPGLIGRQLLAAGLGISPAAAAGMIVLIAILVALLIVTLSPGLYWAGPLAGIAVAWLIWSTLIEAARQRAWRFESRLVDAIDLAVGALSAGQTPTDALASSAEGAMDPVRLELRELASQLRASVPIERAVQRMVLGYDSESVRIFTQLLIAKWEVGGPLAPALQAVTKTMRHSVSLRAKLYTHVAGAQSAAIVVAILPYLLIAIFAWKRPEALAIVWALPWGPQLFVTAIFLQLAGFVWLRRILRIEL